MRSPSDAARRQGRYVLGELLGRGGMAEVFAGHVLGSHGFQKPVAIKRLLPELANDHVFVERLIGEAKLLVGMTHGNIVSVLDLARDGDDVFLVMEFVDGPSLRQLLKARGPRGLSLGTASYIVQAAAAGLEFAHARPGGAIIHADISPSNLLLTTSGEVRVADFGIARREGGQAGVVEGKWAYMAPEQARGEPLTPRCDVFALGVVLYELITGQHPLGQRVTADERDSGPVRIPPPRIVNPAVPAGLDAICMKALADSARDRYARMQHLVDALIDERFANQWREGASDLAQVIGEIAPGVGGASTGPGTQVTDRPVTIMTRSLISQSHRASSPRVLAEQSGGDSVETLESPSRPSLSTGARTSLIEMPSAAQTSMIETPSAARTSQVELVTAAPAMPYGLSPALLPSPAGLPSPALLPDPELASVHGGATVTGASALDLRDTRSRRWPLAVFGVAALIGVIAALAIQLAPSRDADAVTQAAETPTPTERVQMTAVTEPAAAATAVEPVAQPAVQPAPPPMPTVPDPQPQPQLQPQTEPDAAPVELAPVEPVRVATASPRKARSASAARKTSGGDATLRVNTYEGTWAWASVAGQKQYANGAKFKLSAGRYTVRLTNPDLHLAQTCTINLASGQVVTLKVDLEEGACDIY